MVYINDIKNYLKKNISQKRYVHTLELTKLASELAKHYGLKNIKKIQIATLLHDSQKNSKNGNEHSFLASEVAKNKFGIKDKKILNAIKHHTFGYRNMDKFAKIIYVADISEPSRKYKEAKNIRKLAFEDLDKAMVLTLSTKMKYVLGDKKPLSIESVILYNKLLKKCTLNRRHCGA
ncbi:MAG: bis(5'-nucleosyl)-tetraphosphatase (symmetrical) YqeK [Elusimicrobia bacterium]|nr:bis(5'-nucleosyl)-tetraphosphatase (symmetrical) YqeK [Elusimicrobiota bacterium]